MPELDEPTVGIAKVRRLTHGGRGTLVDEQLRVGRSEDGATRPLSDRSSAEKPAVEARGSIHIVREERDLDDGLHVAISNSRRTSFNEVLRSVDALRSPTISAHGRSYRPAGNSFGRVPGSTTERGGT